ncbi:MAG: hypothetical protein HY871_03185 [Chloroflexi bacterium]|nr:hypothetical protein [Chloroflexota bacterium]
MARRFVVLQKRRLGAAENGGRHIIFGTVSDARGFPMAGVRLLMTWEFMDAKDLPGLYAYTGGTGAYEFTTTMGVFAVQVVQNGISSERADQLRNTPSEPEPGHTSYQVDFRLEDDNVPLPGELEAAVRQLERDLAEVKQILARLIPALEAIKRDLPPPPGIARLLWLFGL